MAAPLSKDRHIVGLDGLRALAVTAVVVHGAPGLPHAGLLARIFGNIATAGWAGVQLFFVLSGFLISGILLDTKGAPHRFRNFYVRRSLRIFPPYYAMLVLALLVGPLLFSTTANGVEPILDQQAWLWTYTSNIAIFRHNGWLFSSGWLNLDHAWSLAVEEQFYLAWPLVVFFLPRTVVVVVAATICAASPVLRFALLHRGCSPEVVYSFTPCRLDALALGSLLAILVRSGVGHRVQLQLGRGLAFGGALALVAVVAIRQTVSSEDSVMQTAGYSLLALACAGVVLLTVLSAPGSGTVRFLTAAPLKFIGRYSYGIYLFHGLLTPLYKQLPFARLASVLGSPFTAALLVTAVGFAASILVAFASWHLFERRFLDLKDRLTI
jgi:peptidoglycan/LPS O-acetylase OafA/YrhL